MKYIRFKGSCDMSIGWINHIGVVLEFDLVYKKDNGNMPICSLAGQF